MGTRVPGFFQNTPAAWKLHKQNSNNTSKKKNKNKKNQHNFSVLPMVCL